MGQPVPADDLTGGGMAVPASDLPDAPTPPPSAAPQQPAGESAFSMDPRKGVQGVGEAALSIGSGMVSAPIAGLVGLAGAALPGEPGQGARWAESVQDALTYRPRGKMGETLVDVATLPGRAVNYVADKVGDLGAEHSPELATVGKTSVAALPLLIGARAATKPAPELTPKQRGAAAARDAGFKLTPEEMGSGPVARNAASIAGEPRLARGISNKNQPVIVQKLADDLGIPKGTTVDLDAIKTVLRREHQAYQNVRNTGQVTPSPQYVADLDALNTKFANVSRDFPDLARQDVQAVIDGARRPTFSATGAVDLISQLRQSAADAFASRQSGLGHVYRGVANAVEAELGRHVASIGRPELVREFTGARTRIAQAHLLEDALLSPDTVNPRVYAEAARDRAPLTGGARQVGEFAAAAERSAMKPSTIGTGGTAGDVALALLQRAATGVGNLGVDLLTLGARPALRGALASRQGQWLIDPRTRIASPAAQAMGVGSLPRPQEEAE